MITVISAGLVLIQDHGRRLMDQGVPVSGAWDRLRYEQALALIEQSEGPVFEVLGGSFVAEVDQPTTFAAVGEFASGVLAHSFTVAGGEQVSLSIVRGPAYIAAAGLQVEPTLGSTSTDVVSGLGPAPVIAGMTFSAGGVRRTSQIRSDRQAAEEIAYIGAPVPPQWRVITQARSGTRIAPLDTWDLAEPEVTPSRPVLPGSMQWISANELVILGPDSGVTGGYPVIGVLTTADLSKIARLQVGDHLSLSAVSLEAAVERARIARAWSVVRLPG